MKTVIAVIVLALLCLNLSSQKLIEESMPLKESQGVVFKFDFADNIVFKTWDKNEVKVNVSVDINNNEDNDAYHLTVEETPTGNIRFEEEIEDMERLQKRQQAYDKDGNELYTTCSIDLDIFYEVMIPADAKISLETISGSVEGKELTGELDLSSISGDIDITYPAAGKADLEFKTISGEMYTNFDLSKNDEKSMYKHHYINSKFEYELNGGGKSIELSTISGNIYFRKR